MKRLALLLLAILSTAATLLAQTRGQQQSPPPTNTMPASAEPTSYFVSGQVRTDDNTPLPGRVLIQSVCQGKRHSEGYTDRKGHFSFELGRQESVGQDITSETGATVPGMNTAKSDMPSMRSPEGGNAEVVSNRNLRECELEAVLPGYSSSLVEMHNSTWGSVDVGSIVLHGAGAGAGGGLFVSSTTAAAPADARRLYEKGRDAAAKKKWDDANKNLEKAVQIYPQFAVAWVELAQVQEEKKDIPGAQKSLTQALQADSKLITPYHELAGIAYQQQQWQQVADNVAHEMQLDPKAYPEDWFYGAASNYYLHNFDAAEKSARAGLAADPQHKFPKMEYLLGVTLVQQRNFSEALAHMRNYVQLAPTASDVPKVKQQIAQIEQVAAQSAPQQQAAAPSDTKQ